MNKSSFVCCKIWASVFICNLWFCATLKNVQGQVTSEFEKVPYIGKYKALEIGSYLPAEEIQNLEESALLQNVNIKDKQLYILDFWTTWCGACLASFPYLSSLQSKFNSSIQIILLNAEETQENANERIRKISINNPSFKLPNLPQIYNARSFYRLFPHLSVPHHIWLDRNFKVIAVTRGESTNERNIGTYLNTYSLNLPTKFELMDFEEDKSLLSEGKGRQQNILIEYSLLLDSIYGAPSLFKLSKGRTTSLRIVNRSLLDLIKIAYGKSNNQWASNSFRSSGNIHLNGEPLAQIKNNHLQLDKKYCYEIKVSDSASLYKVMCDDLERFFGVKGEIKTALVPGYTLSQIDKSTIQPYSFDQIFTDIDQLVIFLNEKYSLQLGALDDGGKSDKNIDIRLPLEMLTKEALFSILRNQGLECKPAMVKRKILQLSCTFK